jgi:hypothetical protein
MRPCGSFSSCAVLLWDFQGLLWIHRLRRLQSVANPSLLKVAANRKKVVALCAKDSTWHPSSIEQVGTWKSEFIIQKRLPLGSGLVQTCLNKRQERTLHCLCMQDFTTSNALVKPGGASPGHAHWSFACGRQVRFVSLMSLCFCFRLPLRRTTLGQSGFTEDLASYLQSYIVSVDGCPEIWEDWHGWEPKISKHRKDMYI